MSRRTSTNVTAFRFSGAELRKARKDAALSQERVAHSIGVTLRTLQRWESDASQPKMSQAFDLAREIGVPAEAFLLVEIAA